MTELYRPALLDPDKHKREDFYCDVESLDDWLRRCAGQNRRYDHAATWVVADDQFRVVAYATLSATSIGVSSAPRALAKNSAPKQIPALLVGRLAVDVKYRGLGIGTTLVKHLMATAVELNEKAACKALVAAALDAEARDWWQRFDFTPFSPDPNDLDLYILTKAIKRTLFNL